MVTTPVNVLSLARQYMRTTLADAASFRTWLGVTTQADALSRIYDDSLPPPTDGEQYSREEIESYRRYAEVFAKSIQTDYEATSSDSFDKRAEGVMSVRLFQTLPQELENDPRETAVRFENVIGGVIDDLWSLSGQAGYLFFTSIGMPDPWWLAEFKKFPTLGDEQGCQLIVAWGRP